MKNYYVQNGKVVFLHLGDHHFDSTINNLVPYSTTYPTEHPVEIVNACKNQIQDFMSKVGFKNGGFNVELRISNKDNKHTDMYCDLIKKNPNTITLKIDRLEIWKFSNNRKETYIKSFPLRDF